MNLEEFGASLDRVWRARNYEPDSFAELAADFLARHPFHELTSYHELIAGIQSPQRFPRQHNVDAPGEPALVIWNGSPRFFIEAVFWLEGSPLIRRPSYRGAFTLLAGSAIHTEYSFTPHQTIVPQLVIGELSATRAELLGPGDPRRLAPDCRYIGSLFCLDRPSVAIVVRSYDDPREYPSYEYLKPSLAHDSAYREHRLQRQIQLYRVLAKVQHPQHLELVRLALAEADLLSSFIIIKDHCDTVPHDQVGLALLLDSARERHGALTASWERALAERRRQRLLGELRRTTTAPDQRFFLALLASATDRRTSHQLVRSRYPNAVPTQVLLNGVKSLAAQPVPAGTTEPPIPLQLGAGELALLECLLEGLNDREAIARRRELDPGVKGHEAQLAAVLQLLRHSPLLQPLFA
jgi:hypothetical protein